MTTPPDLPALVRRIWDREDDIPHALDWAEWLEEHGQPERGELVRLEYAEQNSQCDCERGKRIRELRAGLSAWPCRECGGRGVVRETNFPPVNYRSVREAVMAVSSFTVCEVVCRPCGGTGGDVFGNLPLTWDHGFPRWVTLPTVAECVRREQLSTDTRLRLRMEGIDPTPDFEPTPRLRALAATPPWGVPLDGVRAGDREPVEWYHAPGGWAWLFASSGWARHARNEKAFLPDVLRKYLPVEHCPTEQAARDALARGLVAFAREE